MEHVRIEQRRKDIHGYPQKLKLRVRCMRTILAHISNKTNPTSALECILTPLLFFPLSASCHSLLMLSTFCYSQYCRGSMLSRVLRRCSAQQPTAGFVAVASPSLSTSSTSFSRCSSSLPRSTPLFSSPFVRFFATSDSPVLGQKDQFLTQEEFQAKLAERRRHLPVEGEGFKSKEEWQAAMVAKEKARARRSDFRTFDQFLQALSAERELDYEEAEM